MTISLQDYALMAADAYDQFADNGTEFTRLKIEELSDWEYPTTLTGDDLDPAVRGLAYKFSSYYDAATGLNANVYQREIPGSNGVFEYGIPVTVYLSLKPVNHLSRSGCDGSWRLVRLRRLSVL